jgi:dipeptide/tripeptide permease
MNHKSSASQNDRDDRAGRSSTAKAIETAHKITSVSLSFVIPILAGFYCDQWLGSRFVCLLVGMALGMLVAGMQLMKLVSSLQTKND